MADHIREQLTVAVMAAVTGLTTTGANVWRDRDTDERPLQDDELPGLVVADDGEPSEVATRGVSGILDRTVAISITAHVKALTGYSSLLNQILKEVEIAMAAITSPKAVINYTGAAPRETMEGGEKPAVRQVFSFEASYYTAKGVPDVAR